MRIASIDIGTNTVLLYIADIDVASGTIKSVSNQYAIPRVGRGVAETGLIAPESIDSLCNTLLAYKCETEASQCETVLLKSTYPFRTAMNALEAGEQVFQRTGFKIDTIPSDLEAYYSFLGATYNLPRQAKPVVIDIGGGSTEISYGSSRVLLYRKSISIGAVNCSEKYFKHYPLSDDSIRLFTTTIKNQIEQEYAFDYKLSHCLAIAGTPTTLAAIQAGMLSFDEQLLHGSILHRNSIKDFVNEFKLMQPDQILKKYGGLVHGREDVILAGSIILYEILCHLDASTVQVSALGLRHGIILDYCFKTFGKYFVLKY